MDESLEVLAPRVCEEVMEAISNIIEATGLGCVLVEQHVDVVLNFADDILILEREGRLFVGPPLELRAHLSIFDHAIGLRKADRWT